MNLDRKVLKLKLRLSRIKSAFMRDKYDGIINNDWNRILKADFDKVEQEIKDLLK